MHHVKRRKLDQVNATLTKPFRSPLRVDSNSPSGNPRLDDQKPQLIPLSPSADITAAIPHRSPNSGSQTRLSINDSETLALQKQYSALSRQLTKLRQSLDTAEQALQIETTNQNAKLEALIGKWRSVAREAIEDFFVAAKDRVDNMGGLRAWRESTKEQPGFWDDDRSDESRLTDVQKEQLEFQREETKAESEKYGLNKVEMVESQDGYADSFSMEMMLQQMNIDLDVIGYDRQLQTWAD